VGTMVRFDDDVWSIGIIIWISVSVIVVVVR